MGYYDLDKIKNELFITNTNQDDRLEELGDKSDSYLNEQLFAATGEIEPLKEIPSYVRELSNDLTVAYYKKRQSTTKDAAAKETTRRDVKDQEQKIKDYVKSHYGRDVDEFKGNAILKSDSAITGFE